MELEFELEDYKVVLLYYIAFLLFLCDRVYIFLFCKDIQLNKDIRYLVRLGVKRREAEDILFFYFFIQESNSFGIKL